jgi:hypothetical protein
MAFDPELGFDPDIKWEGISKEGRNYLRQKAAAVQSDQQKAWTDFIESRIDAHANSLVKVIGSEVAVLLQELRAELRAEIAKSFFEVAQELNLKQLQRLIDRTEQRPNAIVVDPGNEMKQQLREIRQELELLRTERRSGVVLDLPNPFTRRRSA